MPLAKSDIEKLCEPFPPERLGVKVQATSKDKTKAMLVCYLSHTDVAERLDSVDPGWNFVAQNSIQKHGDLFVAEGELSILGSTRANVGEGELPKEAYSDCLKRCAMLFGVGRYLYESEQVWIPYDEQRDKYRKYDITDYRNYARGKKDQEAPPPDPARPHALSNMKKPPEHPSKSGKRYVDEADGNDVYNVMIRKAKGAMSKKNNTPGIVCEIEILDGIATKSKYAGAVVGEKGAAFWGTGNRTLEEVARTLGADYASAEYLANPGWFIDKPAKVRVEMREWDGRLYPSVQEWLNHDGIPF